MPEFDPSAASVSASPSATSDESLPAAASTDVTATASDLPFGYIAVGADGVSQGIHIRVRKAFRTKSLVYEAGTYSTETPNGDRRVVKAAGGARFLYVVTTGKNRSKSGIDLTCDLPVSANVLDDSGASYEHVEGLSQIKGNPECNAKVNPGFPFKMTWVFKVPTDANITTFAWNGLDADLNDGPLVQVAIHPT